jgi:hypothetical protein
METTMATQDLVFYSSENGDDWLLITSEAGVTVRHRPNAASGGSARDVDLDAFLSREQKTPQNQALRKLFEREASKH